MGDMVTHKCIAIVAVFLNLMCPAWMCAASAAGCYRAYQMVDKQVSCITKAVVEILLFSGKSTLRLYTYIDYSFL